MRVNVRPPWRFETLTTVISTGLLVAACSSPGVTASPPVPASDGASPSPSATAASSAGGSGAADRPGRGRKSGSPRVTHAPAAGSASVEATGPVVDLTPTPAGSETVEPSTGPGTAVGDVPDNAVFIIYTDPGHHFSIQYVEGWQVTPQPDGVAIADKDSSEKVQIVAHVDAASYVDAVGLPTLQQQTGVTEIKRNRVKVKGHVYDHVTYHAPSEPDLVTGKEVPSAVDRYYVPGRGGISVVTLSTPDGVDNVDAFRQMIESFSWQ